MCGTHIDKETRQEHFVQIKEIQPDGRFQDVARIGDFTARIRHARVLGESPKPEPSVMDAFIKAEPMGQSGASDDDGLDSMMEPVKVPPNVLVLTVESGHLLFLFVNERSDGTYSFIFTSKAVPYGRSELEDPVNQIAVDPR